MKDYSIINGNGHYAHYDVISGYFNACRMMTQWRFKRGVEEQTKAFLDGFNEVVPLHWLQFFDERELELMLCGMQELNVNEWEKHTVYRNYTRNTKQVQWFWQVRICVGPLNIE